MTKVQRWDEYSFYDKKMLLSSPYGWTWFEGFSRPPRGWKWRNRRLVMVDK